MLGAGTVGGMTWGWRTAAPALLLAAGSVLAGCSDGQPTTSGAPGVVIPGSTVTIGSEPVEPAEPSESVTPSATETPVEQVPATSTTAVELRDRVAAGVTPSVTATVIVGDGTATSVVADYRFIPADAPVFQATVGDAEVRLVDGALYTRSGADAPWATGADATPDLADYATWNLLVDLRVLLDGAEDFVGAPSVTIDGVGYETYTFTVDATVAAASTQVPDGETGTATVTFSIDSADRPVRVDQQLADSGLLVRTDYTGYGEPVAVEAPDVG